MFKTINHMKVHYEFWNQKCAKTLVLLHGWGQNIEMMEPIAKYYQNDFNILIIDFPGFGQSDEPPMAWSVLDYVEFLHQFLKELKIDSVILIGHSFGGRIALLYSSLYPVEKLICLASPYCPEITQPSWKTKVYQKVKKIGFLKGFANYLRKRIGSSDYNQASEIMRGVLVKAVNTNLTEDVKKIKAPTLLVWGEDDQAVPIHRAYELSHLIPDAGVVSYPYATHYAYLERLNDLVIVLDQFLGVKRK